MVVYIFLWMIIHLTIIIICQMEVLRIHPCLLPRRFGSGLVIMTPTILVANIEQIILIARSGVIDSPMLL